MKNFLFVLGLFCLLCPLQAMADLLLPATSPENVSANIDKYGANVVVQSLLDSNEYSPVMAHIESGDKAWIDIVPKLGPGTDGAISEELDTSLAIALSKNPMAVLAITNQGRHVARSIEIICSGPGIADYYNYNHYNMKKYKQSAISAVTNVRQKNPERADDCLSHLKAWHPETES